MEEKKNKKWDKTELKVLQDAIQGYGRKEGVQRASQITGRTISACLNKYYSYEFRTLSNEKKEKTQIQQENKSNKKGLLWRIWKRIFG